MSQQALHLIAQEKEAKTGYLELGNCGLIPDNPDLAKVWKALGELIHLETLILSNGWWDWKERNKVWKFTRSKNRGIRNYINYIPKQIKRLRRLNAIVISGDLNKSWNIQDISIFKNMPLLQYLYVSNNKVNTIPKLINLKYLDASNNNVKCLDGVQYLSNLRYLNLGANKIRNINHLYSMKCLESLAINSNDIEEIDGLEKLIKLKYLALRNNRISEIKNIECLKCITHLCLSGNYIEKIEGLKLLVNIEYLDLSENKIKKVENINHLKKMKRLLLRNNNIEDISGISDLINLTHVNLEVNNISIAYDLYYLKRIKWLNLNKNKVSNLKLDSNNLIFLSLNDNNLTNLCFLKNAINIEVLQLNNNRINDLKGIELLKKLYKLHVNNNKIENANFLMNLSSLNKLDIGSNQLEKLEGLETLSKLSYLDVSKNQFSNLQSIEKLEKLEKLDISYTKVHSLRAIKNLIKKGISIHWSRTKKGINVKNCPLISPSFEVVKQGNEAILRWLEEAESEGTEPLREAKLLIIGAGGVGKTSLMKKLEDPNNDLPESGDTTVGIDVVQSPVSLVIDGEEHTLNIWDFGGQDIYHPTHQLFLTKNSLYVLMDDGREKKTDLYYWLQVQELLAGKSPLVIVQNIKEESSTPIPINELKGTFSNIKESYDVDLLGVDDNCKDFKKIKDQLAFSLKGLPHIGEAWPKTRFKIKEALQAKKSENYISLKEYKKLCKEHDFNDPIRQKEFLEQLHFLGHAVHFKDDLALQNTVIINPQWATDAIYAILSHTAKHHEKKGRFSRTDLDEVWADEKYEGMFNQIIQLMQKFELCFELDSNTYIAPLLLPNDQPKYNCVSNHPLEVQYHYDFLPKGIMSRLIVKLHERIKDELFWQRGVVVEKDEAIAEVMEDYIGRKISIKVGGDIPRDLMSIIIDHIDSINSSYHFSERIQAKKMVPCVCHKCTNSNTPYFYKYTSLVNRKKLGKTTIECDISFEDVSVDALFENISSQGGLKGKIKFLIGKNRVEECFTFLEGKVDDNELAQLKGRYEKNEEEKRQGTKDSDKYDIEYQKIASAILQLTEEK